MSLQANQLIINPYYLARNGMNSPAASEFHQSYACWTKVWVRLIKSYKFNKKVESLQNQH